MAGRRDFKLRTQLFGDRIPFRTFIPSTCRESRISHLDFGFEAAQQHVNCQDGMQIRQQSDHGQRENDQRLRLKLFLDCRCELAASSAESYLAAYKIVSSPQLISSILNPSILSATRSSLNAELLHDVFKCL